MSFKTFLIEQYAGPQAITYQKLLLALDTAHMTKTENYYEFNLGAVVDDSSLRGLNVRIQKSDTNTVKLGQRKDGKYLMVVFSTKLPERTEIDTLLSSNKSLMNKFIKKLAQFENGFKGETDIEEEPRMTKRERIVDANDSKSFEENYQKLISAIEQKKKEYDLAVKELDAQEEKTVNQIKKATIRQAKDKLKLEALGKSEGEFIKNALKLPEADFAKSIDKELMTKLKSRLENYYEQIT